MDRSMDWDWRRDFLMMRECLWAESCDRTPRCEIPCLSLYVTASLGFSQCGSIVGGGGGGLGRESGSCGFGTSGVTWWGDCCGGEDSVVLAETWERSGLWWKILMCMSFESAESSE